MDDDLQFSLQRVDLAWVTTAINLFTSATSK